MKKIICTVLSLLPLLFAVITPVCAMDVTDMSDPFGYVFQSYEEFEEFVENADEDDISKFPIISKEAYLHYDRLFSPKSIIVSKISIFFEFETAPEYKLDAAEQALAESSSVEFSYKMHLDLFNESDEYATLTDFTEADLEKEYKNVKVTKDGYTFGYTIVGNKVESISFIIGDYKISLSYMYKATDDMAEFRDAGDSADNTIKLIKRFEQLVNGELTDKNATLKPVICVSSALVVVIGGAVTAFYLKRKKTAVAVTDNK